MGDRLGTPGVVDIFLLPPPPPHPSLSLSLSLYLSLSLSLCFPSTFISVLHVSLAPNRHMPILCNASHYLSDQSAVSARCAVHGQTLVPPPDHHHHHHHPTPHPHPHNTHSPKKMTSAPAVCIGDAPETRSCYHLVANGRSSVGGLTAALQAMFSLISKDT